MGTLYVVATPIGNLGDITLRAIDTLFKVDYLVCEDTRRTGLLLKHLQGNNNKPKLPRLISFYEEIEQRKVAEILALVKTDHSIALISDAGTPLISDPGYKLVKTCLDNDIKVISIPGSSALITALTSSGLPANSFWFLGFAPEKTIKRLKYYQSLKNTLTGLSSLISPPTMIFYESSHRLRVCIKDLKEIFGGDQFLVIGHELTKIHESVNNQKIDIWIDYFNQNLPKGEYVLLFNFRP